MNLDSTFAVVDLETTGNSIKNDDRIIQFGCTLIRHNRIIKNFSSNVNPQVSISKRITQLTGISDADVQDAPTWEQLADQITALLDNTVFVAHNVNFDFPFLNYELERVGRHPLLIEAVDTVTLSQILLPSVPSYRLRDLTQYFNIEHSHPHEAISDAHATASLFLLLLKRLTSLPTLTIQNLLKLKLDLPQTTGQLFELALQQSTKSRSLSSELVESDGLILRKVTVPKYSAKLKIDESDSRYQWLYDNFNQSFKEQKQILIEAPNNLQTLIKTLQLMLQLSISHHRQLVVSVSDEDAKRHLIDQVLPRLNASLGTIPFTIFRPWNHLIDLKRFRISLAEPIQSNQFQLLKARILVWLMSTKTGDLSELLIDNYQYLAEINYLTEPNRKGKRDSNDFWQRQLQRFKNSPLIITNHHYLYHHHRFFRKPYLLIYKPLNLPQVAFEETKQKIRLNHINSLIRQLKSIVINSHGLSFFDLLETKTIRYLMTALEQMDESIKTIQLNFTKQFLSKHLLNLNGNHYVGEVDKGRLKRFLATFQRDQKRFHQAYQRLTQVSEEVMMVDAKQVSNADFYLFNRYQTYLKFLRSELINYHQLKQRLNEDPNNYYFKVNLHQPHDINTCLIESGLLNLQQRLKNHVYRFFQPLVAVTPTLSNDSGKGMIEHLNLNAKRSLVKSYSKSTRPRTLFNLSDINVNLDQQLIGLVCHHHLKVVLVFDNLELIRKVYHQWMQEDITSLFNVLAEQLNTSDNKLYKNLINDSEIIGMVTKKMIDDYPEIIRSAELLLFIGTYQWEASLPWLQQTLSEVADETMVGIANFADDKWPYRQLIGIDQQWKISERTSVNLQTKINNFLLNLKKGVAD